MLIYALRKAGLLLLSLTLSSLVIFALIEVIPGDPAQFMLGIGAEEDSLAALRQELGLDQPAPQRYLAWIGGMLLGDFGLSYTYRIPVLDVVMERLAVSLPLAGLAMAMVLVAAPVIAIIAAWRHGSTADHVVGGMTQIGIAVPNFWLAILLIHLFALGLGWFPAGGFSGWHNGSGAGLRALFLPALALAIPQIAILARIMREELIRAADQDYFRTARAKGLGPLEALLRHALRNALLPVLTIAGMQFSFLLAGAIIVENVFALPGLGRLVFQAIAQRDLIMVESVVMLLVFAVVVVSFLVELAYGLADPRVRTGVRPPRVRKGP
ncbi:MAG: peptide ABC transporter [SAR116 cluster bacterium MED-G04]|jgi:peptide/nickel transport system permease protein|nr:MAG: peptide ABC transporter [SAR116 cluster bacterium MED-G04]CAI8439172.1 MAG: Glutathione transport system permease protein GsiC [SAR116 cluster bacterium MED-G04]HCD49279.1 peptide ABC transporter [Alphaproteobacteria bacterium]HCV63376.1 peptide ABC transporter [Alphaproteobacteria bacterium]|tara:strand:+ start:3537 stop:4511 length:975 start_codon:yes stop_codon:yes gene_type:complete